MPMNRPIDAVFRAGLVGWEALAGALVCTAIDDRDLYWFRTNLGQACMHLLGYEPSRFMATAKTLERAGGKSWTEHELAVARWEQLRAEGMSAKGAAHSLGHSVKHLYETRAMLREGGRL